MARSIATGVGRAYGGGMVLRRLMLIVAMLALLAAPMGMIGSHAAMAQPASAASPPHHPAPAAPSGHCAEMGGEEGDSDGPGFPQHESSAGCALACSAICAPHGPSPARAAAVRLAQPLPLAARLRGLVPEAVDPPPRTA